MDYHRRRNVGKIGGLMVGFYETMGALGEGVLDVLKWDRGIRGIIEQGIEKNLVSGKISEHNLFIFKRIVEYRNSIGFVKRFDVVWDKMETSVRVRFYGRRPGQENSQFCFDFAVMSV